MSASSNASGHSGFLDGFANHHAVFLELFGQDGVQEGIAAGIEWQDENGEDFGLFHGDQGQVACGCDGKKGNGSPTNEVGEDQQSHAFSNATVIGIPCLGSSNGAIHLQIASH